MARLPPARSWLMRVPSDVARALRPSLPGGRPGGMRGAQGGVSVVLGSALCASNASGSVTRVPRGLSLAEQRHRRDGEAGKGLSGPGWPQVQGQATEPRPGEDSWENTHKGQPPHAPARPRGGGSCTSVAVSSMSPTIGPQRRAGLGSACRGSFRASQRNASLTPLQTHLQPRGGSGGRKHGWGARGSGGGRIKKPFGTKSAENREVSGSSARAEAVGTAGARPRAGTQPGRLSPAGGTAQPRGGRGCSPSPPRPWEGGATVTPGELIAN